MDPSLNLFPNIVDDFYITVPSIYTNHNQMVQQFTMTTSVTKTPGYNCKLIYPKTMKIFELTLGPRDKISLTQTYIEVKRKHRTIVLYPDDRVLDD